MQGNPLSLSLSLSLYLSISQPPTCVVFPHQQPVFPTRTTTCVPQPEQQLSTQTTPSRWTGALVVTNRVAPKKVVRYQLTLCLHVQKDCFVASHPLLLALVHHPIQITVDPTEINRQNRDAAEPPVKR